MKAFIGVLLSLVSSSAFAATVMLETSTASGKTSVFYTVSSAELSPDGVQIRVSGHPVCLVSVEFLRVTNTSGLDLVKNLSDPSFDFVVECSQNSNVSEGYLAKKIRSRTS